MATDANRSGRSPRRQRAAARDAPTARRAGSPRGPRSVDAGEPTGRPAPESEPELDERKTAILKAVVSEYIDSAQPVGSGHVTGLPGVEVSSATVRSEMAALEREGYLVQPHTSAGRIPTDKGYRFFVDHLGRTGTLGPHQRQEVRKFFAHVHGEVEELLGHTSGLLADLTNYASVVVGPGHESAAIRSVQLVGLSPGLALVVVVLADGAVEKRTVDVPADTSADVLAAAASHLSAHVNGTTLRRLGTVPDVGDATLRAVVDRGLDALADLGAADESDHVYVGGSSRMAVAFDAVETVRSVLSILEQQLVVVELIEDILDRGLSVAIGTEHGFEPLAACALVVAPVAVDGELAGTVGVLGPTRMHYPRALAAVELVGEQLGARLAGTPPGTSGPPRASGTESRRRPATSASGRGRGRRGGSGDGD